MDKICLCSFNATSSPLTLIDGCILPFTEKLDVPGLREINLHVINNDVIGNVNYEICLAPLFWPQQGRIQKLVIDTRYLDHESFLDILRKCPYLISLTPKKAPDYGLDASFLRETLPIDDEFLERISSNNDEILCFQLEEFICDYPAAISTTDMINFIRRKQDGNILKLAKLKKVAMEPYSIERDRHKEKEERDVSLSELEPYISQGLTCDIPEVDLDIPELHEHLCPLEERVVYGNSSRILATMSS